MKYDLFNEKKHRFSIRKFSVGVASVMLGAVLLGSTGLVSADEVSADSPAVSKEETSSSATNASLDTRGLEVSLKNDLKANETVNASSPEANPIETTVSSAEETKPKDAGLKEVQSDPKAQSAAQSDQSQEATVKNSDSLVKASQVSHSTPQAEKVAVTVTATPVETKETVVLQAVVALKNPDVTPVDPKPSEDAVVAGSQVKASTDAYATELGRRRSAAMPRDVRNGLPLPSGTGFRADSTATIQLEIANVNSGAGVLQKQGKITVTGGGTKTEDLSYIDITLPEAQYIDSFELNGGTFASEYERIDNADGSATFRVKTGEITPTTSAQIYFGVNYKTSLLPTKVKDPKTGALVNYSEQPKVTLLGEDKTTVLAPTKGSIKFDFSPSTPVLQKRIMKNGQGVRDNDQVFDGGIDADANGYIDAATSEALEFRFSLNTGDMRNRYRSIDKIISITDDLPTYINSKGQTVRANFIKSENPYWNLSADGTKVTLDVDAFYKASEGVAGGLSDKLYNVAALKLHFPDAKDRVYLTNNASVTMVPLNQRNDLGEPEMVVSDDIKFYLTTETIPKGYFVKNSSNKNNNSVNLIEGSAHLSYGSYSISLKNPTDAPIKEFTITDSNFDSRLYLMGIVEDLRSKDQTELYAIKNDGTEEKVAYLSQFYKGANYDPATIIDAAAYLHNKENAEKIESGALKLADSQAATASYKGFKIKLKDGAALPAGHTWKFSVLFGFLDPLHLDKLVTTPVFENTASLDATLNYKGKELSVKDEDSKNFFTVETRKESVAISKELDTNWNSGFTGNLGSKASYNINVDLTQLGKARSLKSLKIIDVLPKGLDLESVTVGGQTIEYSTIDNYKNSGQQAVVINLGDLLAGDLGGNGSQVFKITGIISDEMVPEKHVTSSRNNINRVYLMADNLNPDQIGGRDGKNMLPDKYDIDGDGDTKEMVYGAEANVTVNIPTELKSIKYIGKEDSETKIIGWNKKMIETDYSEEFYYRLATQNFSTNAITSFVLYDRLPLAGDSRDSKFVNTLRGPVTADDRFEVYYHTALDMSEKPVESIKRSGWMTADQITDFSKVTAIKIQLKAGEEIQVAQTVEFDVPMLSPQGDIRTSKYNGQSATNNYYTDRTGEGNNFGITNSVSNKMVSSGTVKVMYVKQGTDETLKPTEIIKENAPFGEAYTTSAPEVIYRTEFRTVEGQINPKAIQVKYRLVGTRADSAPVSGNVNKDEQVIVYEYVKVSNVLVNYYSANDSSPYNNLGLQAIKSSQSLFPNDTQEGTAFDATTEEFRPSVIVYKGRKYRLATKLTSIMAGQMQDEEYTIKDGVITGSSEYPSLADTWLSEPTGTVAETVKELNYIYTIVGDVDVTYKDEEGNILEATRLIKDGADLGEAYSTEQKEFQDYDFLKMEEGSAPAEGTVKRNIQHVVYVYQKHRGDVLVHFVDEEGNTLKADVKDVDNEKVGTAYDTRDQASAELTVDGKLYRRVPAKTVGDETGVVVKGTTEVTYVYAEVKYGSVVVAYKDEEGNELIPKVTDTAKAEVGTDYSTLEHKPTELTVNGKLYRLIPEKTEGDETGKVVEGETKVTYVYAEVKYGSVVVAYKDEEGNELIPNVTDTAKAEVGTDYSTTDHKPTELTVNGKLYRLVPEKTEGDETGKVVEGETKVTYVYKEVKFGSVTVAFKDEDGNQLIPNVTDTVKAEVGTDYSTTDHKPNEIRVNGKVYRLVEEKTQGEENGKVVEGDTLVTYIYKEIKFGDVIVHYVDENGNTIRPDYTDTKGGEVGSDYNTAENESEKPLTIMVNGRTYELIRVEGEETGKVVEGVTEVTYVYKLKEEPKVPKVPEVPVIPEKPKTPTTPECPEVPHEPQHKAQLPQTGEENSTAAIALAVTAAVGAFGLAASSRKKKED